ncbi:hypothetical protein OSB04_028542 [Centaurea solstitialis]|uniref:Uncharacterized protein n=1 Tax=Centaurea solstitialis TaxID=347529 RepID=A0AA38SSU8_9ASTR|nr:hypothetical protein OSB04_028542 [Centaurea solstitialis]
MASTVTSTNNLSLRSILEKDKLTGSNFLDWERNLMIVLRHERKWYVLEEPLGEAPPATALAAARNAHKKHSDDLLDVACLMLATMSPDLQAGLINTNAYDMIRQLRDMFQTQARTERYDATKAFNECKMIKGTSVSDHAMKMKRHLDHLERLGHPVPLQLATDTILNSLPFVVNYNMNNMKKSIAELHSMLKTAELNMGNKNKTKDVLMVRDGGVKKKNGHTSTSKGKGPVQAVQSAPKKGKGKGKGKKVKPNKARTENRCFTCNEVGMKLVFKFFIQNLSVTTYRGGNPISYKRCRLKVAHIFDRVANIGRDPKLRLLLGISHNSARGTIRWSFIGGSILKQSRTFTSKVGCEECKGPHLTKDFPNRPMMTPEEVHYLNRGDYQGRWNNNRNFIPRPPGFFAQNKQNQRTEGEPRVSIEDRLIQFMSAQKKINDDVGSYLRNHQSTIHNLEMQVGRISQLLSERTQGELPTQIQVKPKVENAKPMLMVVGETSKKKWTDIYTKKYMESDSGSEPDYATDYDSEGFTISFEHLGLKGPISLSDDEEEDGKQGGYAEFMIPKKDKGKEKEKEEVEEDELTYIAPIKHDPGSYSLPISCSDFNGFALIDTGASLNMMPISYYRKFGIKKLAPTDYQYRGINRYMTTPLGIAEGVPIRIGNFVYFTDFVIAKLPKDTARRSFLHTAQVNVDMRNQVTSLGYGEKRIYFNPDGEAVTHLDEPYEDPSQVYNKNMGRPLLPHEHMKKMEDYPNPIHRQNESPNGSGSSKKEHRKKKGSSARRAKK